MMPNKVLSWRDNLYHQLLFRHCSLCQLPLTQIERYWCSHCITNFPTPPYCQHCGTTTLSTVAHCGRCLSTPPLWQRLYRLGEYRPPLQQLVHQLKFYGKFWLAQPLAQQLARQITQPAPLLLPVPLHWRRYCQRGFNQSHQLALALATIFNSRVNHSAFQRLRHTPSQQQLTKTQRRRNLQQAFTLRQRVLPNHVAIIDDVVTTGATVHQLTQLLIHHGVKHVDIYTLCHTEQPLN
ncbi:amidophosphoribosyltransferase [Photobacterium kishitanii]|uniref:ComF family protein n=1 Tax=Photobacterium kishitanii TaxID=318456 RepID=A0A2T3QVZ6_9GAMM|nr:ComF family protein [Photobacterium kishitanii]KJG58137.1 amidophosphoribosyltransferase [Photobacterium kishitanii]KJG61653.1 amidophosphoribosyltransferase [Photobacterium kishitanii]KJG65951.1 amidophosphoribosyltransferase [Photobacterium kishitanii]KJG69801.1 amidophosphoribosyltransferase [Photobacterium kishitanii]PSU90996.1 ComF family protein [Photobacterium kishitanii]